MVSRKAFPVIILVVAFIALFSQVKPSSHLFSPETVELRNKQNVNQPMVLKDLVAQVETIQNGAPGTRAEKSEILRQRIRTEERNKPPNEGSGSETARAKSLQEIRDRRSDRDEMFAKLVSKDQNGGLARDSAARQPYRPTGRRDRKKDSYAKHYKQKTRVSPREHAQTRKMDHSYKQIPGGDNNTQQMAQAIEEIYKSHTSQYCLTDECIDEIAKDLARAFPDRTNKQDWCVPKSIQHYNTTNRKQRGLILVKVPKSASSTAAAVVLRLGRRQDCDVNFLHWSHQHAHKEYARRDPQKSFMFMSVRDPAKQLVSNIFWSFVTLRGIPPDEITDELLTRRVMNFGTNLGNTRHYQGGLQTQFVALEKIPRGAAWNEETRDVVNREDILTRAKAIVDGYDFILVVERMDESLVALALLLNVPVGDVLVTSSKVSAPTGETTSKEDRLSYVYSYRAGACLPMRSAFYPPLLQGYLKSDYFKGQAYGDSILHAAASQSLDLTIERLGVERFQEALKEYQYWKQKEKEECASRVAFPCSSEAIPQLEKSEKNCYDRDLGCGYQCVDEMLARGKDRP